jgi:tRNA modification GTPase
VQVRSDTIIALSTPAGRSGIGVIRISGSESLPLVRKLLGDEVWDPQPNLMALRTIVDPVTSQPLDEAMICYFKAPRSFTGEDIVELHCHGSPVLLRTVIDAALTLGARMAAPGEFSLRAVANGQLQLSEAEAIRDLIEAHTETAAVQAIRQLKGEISNRLQPVKEKLLNVIVRLESSLEFVEDDLPAADHTEIAESLQRITAELEKLAATFGRGKLFRDGLKVTLVGRPNAGKSSLFNGLLGHGRAIVTDIPGTTRDTITESIAFEGIPLVLTDTAGLRTASDDIESIGVQRTKREAADSDLLIVVVDGSQPSNDKDQNVLDEITDGRYVIALNKSDLPTFSTATVGQGSFGTKALHVVPVSAKTEAGLEALRAAILQPFTIASTNGDGLLITNARHYDLLQRAIDGIHSSSHLLSTRASEELILVGLHNALRYLSDVTGETTADEILGQIFSTFCIGK